MTPTWSTLLTCALLLHPTGSRERSLASWAITSFGPQEDLIDEKRFQDWTFETWRQHTRRILGFKYDTFDFKPGGMTVPFQQVLELSDFSFDARRLIARMVRLESEPKYRRQNALETFRATFERRSGILLSARQRGSTTDLTMDDVASSSLEDASATLSSPVEVGAFRVFLKDGRVKTSVFTSGHERMLLADDLKKALLKPLGPLRWDDILAIQLFHTHPMGLGVPLSIEDTDNADAIRNLFAEKGAKIDSHIYAITKDDEGNILVFHYGTAGRIQN